MLSLAGVVLISRPSFVFGAAAAATSASGRQLAQGLERWLAVGLSLFGAMCSAVAYVLVRKLGAVVHAYTLVHWFALFSSVFGAGASTLLERPVLPPGWRSWLMWLCMGVAGWLGQGMLNRGLQLERAGTAASMNYVQIVFAFLFQIFFLKQAPTLTSCVGAALICTYAGLLVLKSWLSRPK